ncbi:MAG TPA: nuclear transport factor 2 family protein [Gemmatimonadales bacterium]|nr:nuclear transport factor 2 family protein [Gemmatimonadales bacterium]
MTETTAGTIQTLGRALIDEFGRGWSKAKIDMMVGVFAPEAVFLDGPFAEPLKGLAAIRGYWADVPLYQSEITFAAGEIFTVGPWFSTEFKCTFRRRRTGEWVDARGAIFCETAGDKITEMRMYWERR